MCGTCEYPSIYLSIYTDTHTHSPGKIRKGRWSWALTVSWKLLSFIQVPTPGLSDTVFVTVPHSHWKSKLLPTGWSHLFNISFSPLYKQKLLSGSSQMTFTLSLIQLLETICGPSRWCDETERQWSSGEEWKHSPSNAKLSELRSCVKVKVDVLGSHP